MIPRDDLEKLRNMYSRMLKEIAEERYNEGCEVFKKLTSDEKISIVKFIIDTLVKHKREGGTYRYLIYDRLGLDLDSYSLMMEIGLFDLHNKM